MVLGDANPDLVLIGETVEPAFGQAERLVNDARLVVGGSGCHLRVWRGVAGTPGGVRGVWSATTLRPVHV